MKKRQINRAKRHSRGCRNNGDCDWCRSSRTHSNKRREPIVGDDDMFMAYEAPNQPTPAQRASEEMLKCNDCFWTGHAGELLVTSYNQERVCPDCGQPDLEEYEEGPYEG